jgi:hypothetical protein
LSNLRFGNKEFSSSGYFLIKRHEYQNRFGIRAWLSVNCHLNVISRLGNRRKSDDFGCMRNDRACHYGTQRNHQMWRLSRCDGERAEQIEARGGERILRACTAFILLKRFATVDEVAAMVSYWRVTFFRPPTERRCGRMAMWRERFFEMRLRALAASPDHRVFCRASWEAYF